MAGKTLSDTTFRSTNVLKSYLKSAESQARVTTGQSKLVLSTCLRTKVAYDADQEDFGESNK